MKGYIISAGYDGEKHKVYLALYNPETDKIEKWYDNTKYLPYLLTNASPYEIDRIFADNRNYLRSDIVEKYDALNNQKVTLTKVTAKTPDAIGGREKWRFKNIIPREIAAAKVWEAGIRFYMGYIYDNDIKMGMPHKTSPDGNLIFDQDEKTDKRVDSLLKKFEEREGIDYWLSLLEYPAPNFERISLDIEVENEERNIPSPIEAKKRILSICFVTNKGRKIAFILRRDEFKEENLPEGMEIHFFDSEQDLLIETFSLIDAYPFVITFNGDGFDMRYLRNRAVNLKVDPKQIPIILTENIANLTNGIHIDLYKFFFIKSIRIYAFKGAYDNVDLDTISKGLIKKGKIKLARYDEMVKYGTTILTYEELLTYNMRDAELTMELTTFNNNLVMNFMVVLSRISKMPIEATSRQAISRWIRSFMYYEHRRRNMLIPIPDDILELKGKAKTVAKIKGKKFAGAVVVEPVVGIHFGVDVIDFASLYPSIFKEYNLGYQTILCEHEECKTNKVPDTPHYICKKNIAIESLFIGTLRDLRVMWYKKKGKKQKTGNWYSVIEQAIKVILNASYGVFSHEGFAFYCPPVSEQITAIGRRSINETISKARALGIEPLYGDTDSVFIKNPTEKQIKSLIKQVMDDIHLELEIDKEYRYCILSMKKNYIGVSPDGKVDVKGMTGKKKHVPPIIKSGFEKVKEIFKTIETDGDFEAAKKEIKKIIIDQYNTFRRRQWKDLDELAFQMALGKSINEYTKTTPQHVKAAKVLQEKGYDVEVGTIIRFIKTRGEPNVKPIQFASNKDVDVDKYIEFLQSTFQQINDAIGLDFENIIGYQKLERWM